ncbi:trigger factor [Candidatus Parcubacteria bacterium]|nr:trigger factor [Candidatus Parcubacteria bacterium]
MKTAVGKQTGLQVSLTVELAPEEFEPYWERAVSVLGREVREPGFRPGKAPSQIVVGKIGAGAVLDRAARLAVEKTYPRALEEQGLETVGEPRIEILKVARANPFIYRAVLAVPPEITLPDWRTIARSIPLEEAAVTEQEVASALQYLREARASCTEVSRPAARGDRVHVDFALRVAGKAVPRGESKNHPLILGEGRFLTGFEDQIIGMRVGEEKSFSLSVPPDFPQQAIAGQTLDVSVALRKLEERSVPELDDAFARSVGEFANAAALSRSVAEGLRLEKTGQARAARRGAILKAIAERARLEAPAALVEPELDRMIHELGHTLEDHGSNLSRYLAEIDKTEADLRVDWRTRAERRVKTSLIIRAIAKAERVTPTPAEFEARMQEVLRQFHSTKEAHSAFDPPELEAYTRGVLRTEKVLELLDSA